jgi:hypothetical protein
VPNRPNMTFELLRERMAQRRGEPLQEQAVHKVVESQLGQCTLSLKAVKTQRNHHTKIGLPGFEPGYLIA